MEKFSDSLVVEFSHWVVCVIVFVVVNVIVNGQLHFRGDPCQDGWPEKQGRAMQIREVLRLTGSGVLPLG